MNKILYIGAALIIAFFAGQYTAKKTVTTTTEQVKAIDKDAHTRTETTTIKGKDGSIKTITLTDKSVNTRIKSDTKTATVTKDESLYKIRVSLLAAYDFTNKEQLTGISVAKSVGPISLGVFGLSSSNEKIGGVMAGWEF